MELMQGTPKSHELKILYGSSRAMKAYFNLVTQFIEEQFPDLRGHITGEVHHSLPLEEFATHILTVLHIIGILWLLIGGEKLLRMIGYRRALPRFYWTIQNNAIPIVIFLFLLAPPLVAKLRTNEAFEIYLGEKIIFSKLTEGYMPTHDQIIKPLVAAGLEEPSKTNVFTRKI